MGEIHRETPQGTDQTPLAWCLIASFSQFSLTAQHLNCSRPVFSLWAKHPMTEKADCDTGYECHPFYNLLELLVEDTQNCIMARYNGLKQDNEELGVWMGSKGLTHVSLADFCFSCRSAWQPAQKNKNGGSSSSWNTYWWPPTYPHNSAGVALKDISTTNNVKILYFSIFFGCKGLQWQGTEQMRRATDYFIVCHSFPT